MMHGLKSVVFAAFIASAAVLAGCGGTEAVPNSDNTELVSRESALRESPHCRAPENYCGDMMNLCCRPRNSTQWGCTSLTECSPGCAAYGECGHGYCIPFGWECEPLTGI